MRKNALSLLGRRCGWFSFIMYVVLARFRTTNLFVKSQGPAKSVVPCSMERGGWTKTVDLKLGTLELG
jgi:hypothetical protein